MSLDDDVSWHVEAMRLRDLDWAERKAEMDEQALTESIEAEASKWRGVFAAEPDWSRNVHYDESGYDRRCFG